MMHWVALMLIVPLGWAPAVSAQDASANDRREIDRRLAAGEEPAHIISSKEAAGDFTGRCPDTAQVVDMNCRFSQTVALWRTTGSPAERARKAIDHCGLYSQVVLNFCSGILLTAVEGDLEAEVSALHRRFASEDQVELEDCKKVDSPCAISGGHVAGLEALQGAWKTFTEARCGYETQYNKSGTGYGAYVVRCQLELIAEQMEYLRKPFN